MSLRDRRVQYETAGLERTDLDVDPIVQWNIWYEGAASAGVAELNILRQIREWFLHAVLTKMVLCSTRITTVQRVCN